MKRHKRTRRVKYKRYLGAVVHTPFGLMSRDCPHSFASMVKVKAVITCLDGTEYKTEMLHCEHCDAYWIPDDVPLCPPETNGDEA